MQKKDNNTKLTRSLKYFFLNFYSKYSHVKTLLKKNFIAKSKTKKVLCRTCCLGNECLDLLKINNQIHFQKLRIDSFLNSEKYANNLEAFKFLKNFQIFDFINQLQINPFSIYRYKYIIFDSFSELVDSKFILPNNKVFYAVKGDVRIDKLLSYGGKYESQINLNNIKQIYLEVFQKLWEIYRCKIFFILCSTKFDKRKFFKERSEIINEAIKNIAKEKEYLICIEPNEDFIEKSNQDNFPYHFNKKTILYISDKLNLEIQKIKLTN